MLRVTSLLCLLPALALATPPAPAHTSRARAPGLAPDALRLQLPERREWSHLSFSQQSGQGVRKGVRTGALAGAVMGGMLGAGSGTMVCSGMETNRPPFLPVCSLVGGVMGAALGAGIGALIGTAASAKRGEWVGGQTQSQPAGDSLEFGLQLGWTWQSEARFEGWPLLHGPGADLRLLARLGPYVALGPELAVHGLLTQEFIAPGSGLLSSISSATLYLLGLQARGGPELGRLRPELVVGFGRFLGDAGFYAGSAGAALSYAVSPRFLPQLEVRYHHSFEGDPGYVTVGGGAALRW